MRINRMSLLIVCMCMTFSKVSGQECSALLKHGIYDVESTVVDTNYALSYANWFCDKKFSSFKDTSDFGATVGIPIEGLPLEFGINSSSDEFTQWYSSFCASVQKDESLKQKVQTYVKKINPVIVKAFTECVSSVGLHVWLERTANPRVFKFAARFNPPGSPIAPPKITSFKTGTNVICDDTPTTIPNVWRTRCTRKDDSPVTLVVNSNWLPLGAGDLDLPGITHHVVTPPFNEVLDVILCSGSNCNLPHIRKGPWQVVVWQDTLANTQHLGPQLSLKDSTVKKVFCKERSTLTAGEFKNSVLAASFRVTDNFEQTRFFDLDGVPSAYFTYFPNGTFRFADNYQFEANHHIRLDITLTLRAKVCEQ